MLNQNTRQIHKYYQKVHKHSHINWDQSHIHFLINHILLVLHTLLHSNSISHYQLFSRHIQLIHKQCRISSVQKRHYNFNLRYKCIAYSNFNNLPQNCQLNLYNLRNYCKHHCCNNMTMIFCKYSILIENMVFGCIGYYSKSSSLFRFSSQLHKSIMNKCIRNLM